MPDQRPPRPPIEPPSTSPSTNPLVLLRRQAQQLAFFDSVPADAGGTVTPTSVTREAAISRTVLPAPLLALLDWFESVHPGLQLHLLRLLQFDSQSPAGHVFTSTQLPDASQLVTLSVTETVVTAEELTVRSYLLFAQAETGT